MKTDRLLGMAAAAFALALAACSTQAATDAPLSPAAQEAGVHPVSGLTVIPLTIISGTSGDQTHAFRVEVAASPGEQQMGLMFRTEMGANEGMIFPLAQVRMASFWMRNTVIPLDIIFIGPDNRIINIARDATPYSEQPIPSDAPAAAVLELNAGRTAELGIEAGDTVQW
ncbi:DUF192 domain-containing protein [Alteraurantiacibacter aestuarii]